MADRHAIIDPFLLALPELDSRDSAEQYLQQLSVWGGAFSATESDYSIAESVIFALWDAGQYPTFEVIQGLIRKYQLVSYTAYDINNYLSVMSARQPFLEGRVGISAVVVAAGYRVEPAVLLERLEVTVRNAFRDSLFLAAMGTMRTWAIDALYCATQIDLADSDDGIRIRGTVELAESLGDLFDTVPMEIDHEVSLLLEPFRAVDEQRVEMLWRDPQRATRCAYEKLAPSERVVPLGRILASSDFGLRLEKLGLHRRPAILRRVFFLAAMASIGRIQAVNGADVHAVRTDAAADAPQLERSDGAKKWRCKVSQTGAGYRLQYWLLPSGALELESVVVESEV